MPHSWPQVATSVLVCYMKELVKVLQKLYFFLDYYLLLDLELRILMDLWIPWPMILVLFFFLDPQRRCYYLGITIPQHLVSQRWETNFQSISQSFIKVREKVSFVQFISHKLKTKYLCSFLKWPLSTLSAPLPRKNRCWECSREIIEVYRKVFPCLTAHCISDISCHILSFLLLFLQPQRICLYFLLWKVHEVNIKCQGVLVSEHGINKQQIKHVSSE